MSDNFHFDLTGIPLDKCLEVATLHHKAIGYREQIRTRGENWGVQVPPIKVEGIGATKFRPIDVRLILFWSDQSINDPINRFPAVMGPAELEPIIKAWLAERQYPPEPDHDGSNHKGWRVYNEQWGKVNDEWQAFAAIEPVWLEYGK